MYNITMEELKFEVDFILDSCVTEVYEYFFIFFMLDRHLRILKSCKHQHWNMVRYTQTIRR